MVPKRRRTLVGAHTPETFRSRAGDSKMMGDGRGGAWILCKTGGREAEGLVEAKSRLWHVDQRGKEHVMRDHAAGGCAPCACRRSQRVAHLTSVRLRCCRNYPANSRMVGDGAGTPPIYAENLCGEPMRRMHIPAHLH
jgi:hypothetical protein